MRQILYFNRVGRLFLIFIDLCLLNVIFGVVFHLFGVETLGLPFSHSFSLLLIFLNLIYLILCQSNKAVLSKRFLRPERIVGRALRMVTLHAVLFISLTTLTKIGTESIRFYVTFYTLYFIFVSLFRLSFVTFLKCYRRRGGNSRSVLLVGSNDNIVRLYHHISADPATGFRVQGYFDDAPSESYPAHLPYLGTVHQVLDYIRRHSAEQIYSGLSADQNKESQALMNYCESHFIRFFIVPDLSAYLQRTMHIEMLGSVPVLYIREEPMARLENRILKRAFDILFSLFVLIFLFPFILPVVAIAIKVSSPGPVFFKQRRSGRSGREFWCYKFRSMRVNTDADRIQATAGDARTTRVGEFLRRTSIDELPQFINVLIGTMSVVGPRPHMLKHTEEYSRLIGRFMVRHWVKPGITGWAQVTGYRGETKELWQMQERVERDVWYLEHWTFLLDLLIIYKTIKNGIVGDPKAY